MAENSFFNNGILNLDLLLQLQEKPAPFTPGEPLFWDDPHISGQMLANVCRALKPGGYFVLDVTTPQLEDHRKEKTKWYAAGAGFWQPTPHIVLDNSFKYLDQSIYLDQYIIIKSDGARAVYRNWFQDFTPEMIWAELSEAGFDILSLCGDLTSEPYQEGCE
ncbi:MAG: hypothetical protein SVT56_07050 [Chloroflexota bacterium]|jgi:hypothetical protein|nr:hypothetical protein [Chloroflexota bacterium]